MHENRTSKNERQQTGAISYMVHMAPDESLDPNRPWRRRAHVGGHAISMRIVQVEKERNVVAFVQDLADRLLHQMTRPTVSTTLERGPSFGDGIMYSVVSISSQYTLELASRPRQKVEVRAAQIAFECFICGATRDQCLVQGGVLSIPAKPVLI